MRELFLGPAGLILLGTLISAAGAFWGYAKQNHFENDISLKSQLLLEKNKEIARIQESIKLAVTGEGFCYLSLTDENRSVDKQKVMLINPGDYPMYDVNIRIVDLAEFSEKAKKGKISFDSVGDIYPVGEIGPQRALLLLSWILPDSGVKDLNIFFSSRKGFLRSLSDYGK